jgi:hypothetical protein
MGGRTELSKDMFGWSAPQADKPQNTGRPQGRPHQPNLCGAAKTTANQTTKLLTVVNHKTNALGAKKMHVHCIKFCTKFRVNFEVPVLKS